MSLSRFFFKRNVKFNCRLCFIVQKSKNHFTDLTFEVKCSITYKHCSSYRPIVKAISDWSNVTTTSNFSCLESTVMLITEKLCLISDLIK
jgi:hypothetical protein